MFKTYRGFVVIVMVVIIAGVLLYNTTNESIDNEEIELKKMSLLIQENFKNKIQDAEINKILISESFWDNNDTKSIRYASFSILFNDGTRKCIVIYEKENSVLPECFSFYAEHSYSIYSNNSFFTLNDIRDEINFNSFGATFYIIAINNLFNFLEKEQIKKSKNIESWNVNKKLTSS